MTDRAFNAALWAKSMSARFKADYGNQPAVQNNAQVNVKHTDADPRQIARALLAIINRVQMPAIEAAADEVEELGDT